MTDVAHAGAIGVALSTAFAVSSEAFAGLTPVKQTELLNSAGGLPIRFFPNFSDLRSKKLIIEKIMRGEDVSLALEFNSIDLTDEEKLAVENIKPLIEKLGLMAKEYEWAPETTPSNIGCNDDHVWKENNQITLRAAKAVWDKATLFWTGGPQPARHRVDSTVRGRNWDRSQHQATYSPAGVAIGCQRITKAQLEWVARRKNWQPQIFRG